MAYPSYTKDDLSDFSGRPSLSYTAYSAQAITQAVLLFKIGTCLADFPQGQDGELAKMAILSMADSIFLAQKYQEAAASPFNSESIGSYSYSKTAKAVSSGQPTGIMWFDLAVDKLGVCEDLDNIPFSGGIEVFEHDAQYVHGGISANARMLSPQDLNVSRSFGYDPAPGYPGQPVGPMVNAGLGGGDDIVWDDPELPSIPDNWTEDPNNPGFFIAP